MYCLPTKYENLQGLHSIAQPSFVYVSLSISELCMSMHIPIVICCGAKRVLFTNTLSEYWCHIIKPYLFTKFHTSNHLGKGVTQTCMFTLFFVVVRKGYCLPTSYQNVGVISVIPICLQSSIHPSIYVRKLRKHACSHCSLLWCENGIVYQQVIGMLVSYH